MTRLFMSSDFWIGYFVGAGALAAVLAVLYLFDRNEP
jgi:hypothetical protein